MKAKSKIEKDCGVTFNTVTRRIKPKLSKSLAKRTRLNAGQLERVKGQAGNGLASRYLPDGSQSLELTRRLAKAQKKAKKFILYSDQLGKRIYLSGSLEDYPLTFEKKEALTFLEGFDDPERKIKYWNERVKLIKFKSTHHE